uniref:HicB family protein n=1 Tax=Streptomyces sp. NBC_00049 TaxID=2903617 RepID=A0AAU2JMF5_9ACTN
MDLQFVGIDPNTGEEGSPTVWVEEETADLVIQGVTAEELLTALIEGTQWVPGHVPGIPPHEAVIRIPVRMTDIIRKACDAAEERARLLDSAGADADVRGPSGDA